MTSSVWIFSLVKEYWSLSGAPKFNSISSNRLRFECHFEILFSLFAIQFIFTTYFKNFNIKITWY